MTRERTRNVGPVAAFSSDLDVRRMITFRGSLLALLLVTGGPVSAWCQATTPNPSPADQGNPEENAACTRDAIRFCHELLTDNFRVLACLKENREKITRACRLVLEKHGQ